MGQACLLSSRCDNVSRFSSAAYGTPITHWIKLGTDPGLRCIKLLLLARKLSKLQLLHCSMQFNDPLRSAPPFLTKPGLAELAFG